jgi:N-acetylmuramoyl-L-alanine amidase
MSKACDKLRTFAKDKWIAFYEMWKERTTLVWRINEINRIAKENWYNEKNSLLVELHWNYTSYDVNKSWTEVFFSQLEWKSNWLGWEDFAQRMAYEVKKLRPFWNYYEVKSDFQARYKQIWILSNTKPLAVLVEYWFLSNKDDVIMAKKWWDFISQWIVNWVINFMKF